MSSQETNSFHLLFRFCFRYYLERPPSEDGTEAPGVKEQERAAIEKANKVKEQEEKKAAVAVLKAQEQARQQEREAIREAAKNEAREAEKTKKAEAAATKAAAAKGVQNAYAKPPKLAKAPNGVPSIMSWKQRDDGTYINYLGF
jgi:archaellum component FlaD/FlaE